MPIILHVIKRFTMRYFLFIFWTKWTKGLTTKTIYHRLLIFTKGANIREHHCILWAALFTYKCWCTSTKKKMSWKNVDVAEVACFCSIKVSPFFFFRSSGSVKRARASSSWQFVWVCVRKYCADASSFSLSLCALKSKGEVALFFTVILTSIETCQAQFRGLGQGQTLQERWVLWKRCQKWP